MRILLLVDISGSMSGQKLHAAKTAMIMLCEALENLADVKIVLFTALFHAINIQLKDFGEKLNPRKADKFGCHSVQYNNADGISMKNEAAKS